MNNNGFLLLDKPKGVSSFDLVRQVKKNYFEKVVGHSGTLDKEASGLMIIALAKATRLLKYFIGLDKKYEVLACFGFKTASFDASEEKIQVSNEKVSKEKILEVIKNNFLGEISQVPPKYSALKIKGERASDIIRKGGDVEIKPRKITVFDFKLIKYDYPLVLFKVSCSSGTYIRSLVNDLGEILGVGAYVEELKRHKIGKYDLNDVSKEVINISDFVKKMPTFKLTTEEFQGLQNGKRLSSKNFPDLALNSFAFFENNCVGVLEKSQDGSIKLCKGIIK